MTVAVDVCPHTVAVDDCLYPAAWDYDTGSIRFGCGDLVLDGVAVYHEYAHAVIDALTDPSRFPFAARNSNRQQILAAATCEALADYLACSWKDYPRIAECRPGDRRHLDASDGLSRYDATRADPYDHSLCLSRALWEIRELFISKQHADPPAGKQAADMLILGTLNSPGSRPTLKLSPDVMAGLVFETAESLYPHLYGEVERILMDHNLL